ncbi:MAG: hypothetical protein QW795_03555 [Candidatus Bathyarchaeia archaeon]
MEEITRPPIIEDGKWGKNVRGIIRDLNNNIIGVVLQNEDNLIIEFFGKISPIIIYNRYTKKAEVKIEEFPKDPKEYFKLLKW